jgi:hypothetical protein
MAHLFLDCDGVLADFDHGVHRLTGSLPHQLELSKMWSACARHDNFFGTLELMDDQFGGMALWNAVKHVNPTILTGIPFGGWAPKQKREWAGRQFGFDVPVITCWSKEKHTFGKPGDILVDDRKKAQGPWESMGGVFVLHKNTKDTLAQLTALGAI